MPKNEELNQAAIDGDVDAVDALLQDAEITEFDKNIALLRAVENAQVGTVKALVKGGANVNYYNEYGIRKGTSLSTAVLHYGGAQPKKNAEACLEIIRFLLSNGANDFTIALERAVNHALYGDRSVLNELLNPKHSKTFNPSPQILENALNAAAIAGNVDIIRSLLKRFRYDIMKLSVLNTGLLSVIQKMLEIELKEATKTKNYADFEDIMFKQFFDDDTYFKKSPNINEGYDHLYYNHRRLYGDPILGKLFSTAMQIAYQRIEDYYNAWTKNDNTKAIQSDYLVNNATFFSSKSLDIINNISGFTGGLSTVAAAVLRQHEKTRNTKANEAASPDSSGHKPKKP